MYYSMIFNRCYNKISLTRVFQTNPYFSITVFRWNKHVGLIYIKFYLNKKLFWILIWLPVKITPLWCQQFYAFKFNFICWCFLSSQDSSIVSALDWYHKGCGFKFRQGREIYISNLNTTVYAVSALAHGWNATKAKTLSIRVCVSP